MISRTLVISASLLLLTNSGFAQVHFDSCISNTGSNATVIVDVADGSHSLLGGTFQVGDEVAFMSEDGACVGTKSWTGSNFALTLWGDDPTTSEKDGLYPAETIEVRVWSSATNTEYGGAVGTVSLAYVESPPFIGGGVYYPDGLYNLSMIAVEEISPNGRNKISARKGKGNAKEKGKDRTGAFKISRDGSLEKDVTVYFTVQGTAENGIDYERLDSSVVIGTGNAAAYVVVDPIADNGTEGTETVSIVLLESGEYDIEQAHVSALLTIADFDGTIGTSIEPDDVDAEAEFNAYPNPFADGISVDYVATADDMISIGLFDAIGRAVGSERQRQVVNGQRYRFELSTRDLPVGVYFVRILGSSNSLTKTVTRIR